MRIAELVNLNGNRKGGGHNKNKCRWGDRREHIPKCFPNRREFFSLLKLNGNMKKSLGLLFQNYSYLEFSLYLNI